MTAVFSLKNVSKRYGKTVALNDVCLSGEEGKVIALLGENGAGKTTALRILLGLIAPDTGEATVLGKSSLRDGEEIRRNVGYVSERPVLYEWMTVEEIGWFAAGFYPTGTLERFRELMREFELEPGAKIKNLSKGTKAKVSLALALAHDPKVLILDEPTSGLDPLVRKEFLESMVDLAARDRTVLLSSHQIAEVERVADVVAILHEGKLVACEPLEELKTNVRELTVTLSEETMGLPSIQGRVIAQQRHGRQGRLLVRDLSPVSLEQLEMAAGVQTVESRAPSLEEIFVGYMDSRSLKTGA